MLRQRSLSSSLSLTLVLLALALPSLVAAQDVPDASATPEPAAPAQESPPPIPPSSSSSTTSAEPASDETLLSDEQALYEEEVGVEEQYSGAHPHEEADKNYFFLGAFYRHQFVPSSMIELFVDAAPSENMPQFGGEFIRRRNNMDIIASVYYADFHFNGPFLAKDDPPTDVEWLDSDLWSVMGAVTFLWSSHFSDWFAIEGGFGVGLGYVFGNLVRTEAYPTANGHARCTAPTAAGLPGTEAPGQPFAGGPTETVGQYCAPPTSFPSDADGSDGEHYGVTARSWFDGGSRPDLWFRLAPQLSLRFKPMHQIVLRIDGGFDLFSGVFVGAAAAFGF